MNKRRIDGSWVDRLFKQSKLNTPIPSKKAHLFHLGPVKNAQNNNPFCALFQKETNNPLNTDSKKNGFQKLFEPELSSSIDKINQIQLTSSHDSASLDKYQACHFDNQEAMESQFLILDCHSETPDTQTFRLYRNEGGFLNYLPGQYVTISKEIGGQVYKRSYSLASTPTRPGNLEITVKRDPHGGIVSNWLNDNLKAGDQLRIKGPFGRFSCAKHNDGKILMIAAGSGIVPIMSMLRWLTDTDARVNLHVLLSFRTPDDIIYRDELKLIAARHNNIKIDITLTTDAIVRYQWRGLTGHINEKMIAGLIPDIAERTVYLCGPEAFMTACKKNLLGLNINPEKLFFERFTVTNPSVKALSGDSGQRLATKPGNYRVSFTKSGKVIFADGRRTLLELAEKTGVTISHECLSGSCGECMVKCLKGKVEMTDQAEIDLADKNNGWIYCCCSYPASNIELDA
jgi:glycine betaine catabolism B